MKKIRFPKELTYVIAVIGIAFSVAMIATTGFGVSMIVAPAYVVSMKFSFLTFGQAEYIVQGIWFVLFCIFMRSFKVQYFFAFVTSLFYGAVLDFWQSIIPHFNPEITAVGSLPICLRILYFCVGTPLTAFTVALFFKTYLYPQVYDFFVKCVAGKYNISQTKFKTGYDLFNLILAVVLTLCFFKAFVGVGPGTVITALINGVVIGFFSRILNKYIEFYALFPKVEKYFEIK